MMTHGNATCLLCTFAARAKPQQLRTLQPWRQARSIAQLRKRAPARMELSSRVNKGAPKTTPSGTTVKRKVAGPFGGMNMTEPRLRGLSQRQPSAAEQKRATRGRTPPVKETSDKSGTFRALKMQRALSDVPYGLRSKVKESISNIESFTQFSFIPSVHESIGTQALNGLKQITPTPVQRLAIPALMGSDIKKPLVTKEIKEGASFEQFLLAAETGSGKTLAYLLPTIDAIKRAEATQVKEEALQEAENDGKLERAHSLFELAPPPLSTETNPTCGRPRAIVLVPTSELVSQVGSLAKSISHTVKFRTALLSSTYTPRVIRNRLFAPGGIDVLVCTPHLLSSIAESDPNILSRVTHLIVDEADSLFDRSFAPLTSGIVDRSAPSLKKLILCSATIPRSLDSYLRKRFPDIRRLVTPNLHAIPRRVQLGIVDVERDPYRGDKNLACADTIWTIGKAAAENSTSSGEIENDNTQVKRILVFVNERETAQELADYLNAKGIDTVALSRDTTEQRKSETLAGFTSPNGETVSLAPQEAALYEPNFVPANKAAVAHRKKLANTKVLVTTDLGSRGIDTLAVRTVILHDVPHTTIDFIHRLGRTGRMGRRGRGIVLVGKDDRRDIVREVKEGMFKGQALI